MTEEKRPIPVRAILLSWGLAVLVLSGLFSAWIYTNQERQDKDMCTMIGVFLSGPEPLPGPEGERSRVVRKAMGEYFQRRDCPPA